MSNGSRVVALTKGRFMLSVADSIKKTNSLGDALQDLVVARGSVIIKDDKTSLLMGHWSLTFDLFRGIIACLDSKLYGPAFALVRPLLESTIRAHVVIMGDAKDLELLRADKYKTDFAGIGAKLDAFFKTETLFNGFLSSGRHALHSYTHAGTAQLGRRFSGTDLMASYSDEEVMEVLGVNGTAAFLVNNLVVKNFEWNEEVEKNNGLYMEWGPNTI
jgi:hypothetical protein